MYNILLFILLIKYQNFFQKNGYESYFVTFSDFKEIRESNNRNPQVFFQFIENQQRFLLTNKN